MTVLDIHFAWEITWSCQRHSNTWWKEKDEGVPESGSCIGHDRDGPEKNYEYQNV